MCGVPFDAAARYTQTPRTHARTHARTRHIGQQTNMNLNPTPGIACGINLAYDFLPKVLKQKGYATWALGKWHLGFLTNQFTPTGKRTGHFCCCLFTLCLLNRQANRPLYYKRCKRKLQHMQKHQQALSHPQLRVPSASGHWHGCCGPTSSLPSRVCMANVWLQRCSRADVRLNLLTSSCFIDVIKKKPGRGFDHYLGYYSGAEEVRACTKTYQTCTCVCAASLRACIFHPFFSFIFWGSILPI